MKLKNIACVGAVIAASLALSSLGHATVIVGEMQFTNGGVSLLTASGAATTIASSTPVGGLDFISVANVSPFGTTGDYSSAIGQTVSFAFDPYFFTNSGLLWTAGIFNFHVGSATAIETGAGSSLSLSVFGTGIVKAAGFTDTPGTWIFTTQGSSSQLSWTSSVTSPTSVPDGGATVALLGVSMLGLHSLRRKFAKR